MRSRRRCILARTINRATSSRFTEPAATYDSPATAAAYGQPSYPQQSQYPQQPGYGPQQYPQQSPYPQQPAYSQQPGYAGNGTQPGYGQPAPSRRPMYSNGYAAVPRYRRRTRTRQPTGWADCDQVAGPERFCRSVLTGASIPITSPPGQSFQGIVLNDVVSGGAVAIPRGATVQGTVVESRKAGALSGRGELALALNGLVLWRTSLSDRLRSLGP